MVDKTQDRTPTPTERVYEPPQVKDLGSVEELTQGPGAGIIDGLAGVPGGFS